MFAGPPASNGLPSLSRVVFEGQLLVQKEWALGSEFISQIRHQRALGSHPAHHLALGESLHLTGPPFSYLEICVITSTLNGAAVGLNEMLKAVSLHCPESAVGSGIGGDGSLCPGSTRQQWGSTRLEAGAT